MSRPKPSGVSPILVEEGSCLCSVVKCACLIFRVYPRDSSPGPRLSADARTRSRLPSYVAHFVCGLTSSVVSFTFVSRRKFAIFGLGDTHLSQDSRAAGISFPFFPGDAHPSSSNLLYLLLLQMQMKNRFLGRRLPSYIACLFNR